jgi:hypothetical protein
MAILSRQTFILGHATSEAETFFGGFLFHIDSFNI